MFLSATRHVIIFCLAGLIASQAAAARQVITIYTEDYPPYSYTGGDGTVVGEATARVRTIMKEAGLDFQIQLVPWARGFRLASIQSDALIFSLAYSQERADAFDWLAPVARPDLHLYVRKDLQTPVTRQSIKDGRLTALCVESDASCNILRRIGFPQQALVLTGPSGASELMMVHYRRADVYLGDENLHPYRETLYGVAASTLRPAMKVEDGLVFFLAAGTHVSADLRSRVRASYQALIEKGHADMLMPVVQQGGVAQYPGTAVEDPNK